MTHRGGPWLPWIIVFAPAALSLGAIVSYSVDAPSMDEWGTPGELYLRMLDGTVSLADFFKQQTDSRPLVPRLLYGLLGMAAGWRVSWVLVFCWLISVSTLIVLLQLIPHRTRFRGKTFFAIGALFSLLVFSPAQWHNQLWGFSLLMILPATCLVVALWLQTRPISFPSLVLGCVFLNEVATFSFANGILCWGLALPLLRFFAITSPQERRTALGWMGFYFAVSAITIGFYFVDFKKLSDETYLIATLDAVLQALHYYVVLLGSPWVADTIPRTQRILPAALAGGFLLTGVVGVSMVAHRAWKQATYPRIKDRQISLYYPWLCLMAYGLLSGLLTTVGRSGMGVKFALGERYTHVALWVPIGLAGLSYALWYAAKPKSTARRALAAVMGLLLLAVLPTWSNGLREMKREGARLQQDQLALRLLHVAPANPLLRRIYPRPEVLRKRALTFFEHDFLPFEPIGEWLREGLDAPEDARGGRFYVRWTSPSDSRVLHLSGWARLPGQDRSADVVIVARKVAGVGADVVSALVTGIENPKFAESVDNRQLQRWGFVADLPVEFDTLDSVAVYAVDLEQQRVHALARVERPNGLWPEFEPTTR